MIAHHRLVRALVVLIAGVAPTFPFAAVTAPPPSLGAPAFYKKYVDADGIAVLSSALVPDTALYVARDTVRTMLAKRPDVRATMIQNGARLGIMAKTEVTTDIPEHANLYTQFPGTDWNTRARGLGGTMFIPISTCAEENVLAYVDDPYQGESILVHEFAHGIMGLGITQVDATFQGRLQAAFTAATGAGKWANTYAGSNVQEYWAEGVQSWFNTNIEAIPTNGIHNAINTRTELQTYDAGLYALVAEFFNPFSLPWIAPATGAVDRDGDGIPDAVEGPEDTNRLVRDNDIFTSARLFAMQQYRDFLGREGDAAGVTYWSGQLGAGAQNRGQMVETYFNSAEFQGTGSPVARLYFAYFLRIPDYGGLQHWIGQFRSGTSLSAISQLFAASGEFVNRYGALTNSQFVSLVYNNVLGRAPDSAGLAHWTGQINGGMSRGDMMIAFSESAEYRALIGNEIYVTMMYVGMLRRAPDAGGFAHWVSYKDAGNSGLALTNAFLAAPEYRNRFLP